MYWGLFRHSFAFASLLFFLSTVLACGGCADLLILHPTTDPLDAKGAAKHLLTLADGKRLEIWIARSPGCVSAEPQAFLVQFHGNDMRAEEMAGPVAKRWGSRPVEVWAVNFPGFGGSSGPARLKAIPPAALAAYDAVSKSAAGRSVYVAGQSLGCTAALYVASQRAVAGLILQNPPALRSIILGRFGWWNLWLLAGPVAKAVPDELEATLTAPHVTAPALFIVADADNRVIPKFQEKVIDCYAGPKHVMHLPHGSHTTPIAAGEELEHFRGELDWLLSQGDNDNSHVSSDGDSNNK